MAEQEISKFQRFMGLSPEKVNIERQPEMNLAKTLCLLLMIFVHTFDDLYAGEGFTAFTAIMFMFVMGMGLAYSRRQTPELLMKRGFETLTISLLLNFCREGAWILINYCIYKDYTVLPGLINMMGVDILDFAGWALILTGLLKKLKASPFIICLIAIVMGAIGTVTKGLDTGCYPANQLLSYFLPTNAESYFPLFNWYVVVAFGLLFGGWYQHIESKNKFYRTVMPFGLICGVALFLLYSFNVPGFYLPDGEDIHYGWLGCPDALLAIGIVMFLMGVNYYVCKVLHWKLFDICSTNVNSIYCTHWVLVLGLAYFIPKIESFWVTFFTGIAIAIAAYFLAYFYKTRLKQGISSIVGRHKALYITLVWVLAIALVVVGYIAAGNLGYDMSDYPNFLNGYYY